MGIKTINLVLLIVLLYLAAEGVSLLGLYRLREFKHIAYTPVDVISSQHKNVIRRLLRGEAEYIGHSATVGWAIKEKGKGGSFRANAAGIRSDKEYGFGKPSGIFRISSFGDSFTHGDGVANEDTWQAIMEKENSGLEVINFGVCGYGLDQAFPWIHR